MPSVLFDRLHHVLLFEDELADEIICEETDLLEKIIPRMFEVVHRVAKYVCAYVIDGRRISPGFDKIEVGTVGGRANLEAIREIEIDLTNIVEDFARALNVEDIHLAKKNGKHSRFQSGDNLYSMVHLEQDVLFKRLKFIEVGHHKDLEYIRSARPFLLERIMAWVANGSGKMDERNLYWIYSSPGIGKTSVARSICASLQNGNHLAGAFFCSRGDPNSSDPRNILLSLIHKLARTFPPFRNIVAETLRNDPNLTSQSMKYSLLIDLIRNLSRLPKRILVFVIDALDESGNAQNRSSILKVLNDAALYAPWLKIIITSRPEVDIQRFFDALAHSSHFRYDLAVEEEATSDLRIFARDRFSRIASMRHFESPWPDQSLFDEVTSLAGGLFMFIETIALDLEQCDDPTEHLKATVRDSVGTSGLTALYGLYSSILRARIVHSHVEFQRVIGVLLATTPYRALCEETIAELAEVKYDLVKMWVENLGPLLYRSEGTNEGIHVRHSSISDFFVSNDCHGDYQINLRDASTQLGITCIKTMLGQLRFNICKLEDSRLANADVQDLGSRIKENISDALQYSCLYWSIHLCLTPDNGDQRVWKSLKKFFEGPYTLFWVEVLSILGMVPFGISRLRDVVSIWGRVSAVPACPGSKLNLIWCRMAI